MYRKFVVLKKENVDLVRGLVIGKIVIFSFKNEIV